MLNNIMLGRYYSVHSRIHMMNPLAKIIATALFVVITFLSNTLEFNVLVLLFLFLIILNTRIPLIIYFKTIKSLRFLLLFILIISLISNVNITVIIITLLRIIYIVLYTSMLTLTTPPSELTYGIRKFFSFLKIFGIPVNKMALSISLALRFIPMIIDQANKIFKSQASRGIDYYNSNLKGKLLALKSLIIPMFVLALKKADVLADSMELRLFNINEKRINFRQNKWGLYDIVIIIIHLLFLIFIIRRGVIW